VIGPVGVFQANAYLTQSLFDYHAIERKRGASYNEKSVHYSLKNARELVVLAVGNAYLIALSGSARVGTAQADVQTAQALYDKASDQQKAGVNPAIDTLRAHVELQSRQQQLIVARNDYAKQKLMLGRVIGLPLGQEIHSLDRSALCTAGDRGAGRGFAARLRFARRLSGCRAAGALGRGISPRGHRRTLSHARHGGKLWSGGNSSRRFPRRV